MDKKIIYKLAHKSYKGDKLDVGKVDKIVKFLSRNDLKKYVFTLKSFENKRNLIVSSPKIYTNKKIFEKLFPNKKIIFKKDPSLILGMEIIDDDVLYKFSLKNTLSKMLSFIKDNYD